MPGPPASGRADGACAPRDGSLTDRPPGQASASPSVRTGNGWRGADLPSASRVDAVPRDGHAVPSGVTPMERRRAFLTASSSCALADDRCGLRACRTSRPSSRRSRGSPGRRSSRTGSCQRRDHRGRPWCRYAGAVLEPLRSALALHGLHDVPLEDAWAVPLSGGGAGGTFRGLAGRDAHGTRGGLPPRHRRELHLHRGDHPDHRVAPFGGARPAPGGGGVRRVASRGRRRLVRDG